MTPICRLLNGKVHVDVGALRAVSALRGGITARSPWERIDHQMRTLRRRLRSGHRRRLSRLLRQVDEFESMPNEHLADWIRRLSDALGAMHAPWASLLPRRETRSDQLLEIIHRVHPRQDPQLLLDRLTCGGLRAGPSSEEETEWRDRWIASLGPQDRPRAGIAVEELRAMEHLLRLEAEALAAHRNALDAWLQAAHSRLGVMSHEDLQWLRVEEICDALSHPGKRNRLPPLIVERREEWSTHRVDETHDSEAQRGTASSHPADPDWLPDDFDVVSVGQMEGRIRHLRQPEHLGSLLHGEIALVPDCDLRWAGAIGKCQGIVAQRGAVMSPLARACRQAGFPMFIPKAHMPIPSEGGILRLSWTRNAQTGDGGGGASS
jgi:hypothetical protein